MIVRLTDPNCELFVSRRVFYLGIWRHIIDPALVLITLESCIVLSYRRTDVWSVLHARFVLLCLSLTIYDNLSYLSIIIIWLIALMPETSTYVLCRCIPTVSNFNNHRDGESRHKRRYHALKNLPDNHNRNADVDASETEFSMMPFLTIFEKRLQI